MGPDSKSIEERQMELEAKFREREISIKEREQSSRETELELKRHDHNASKWRNPLIVAVFAAIVAALGNAFVSYLNSNQQQMLERDKAEQARILEVIKTGNDPDKAAENLKFLLESGLIAGDPHKGRLQEFLATREPGTGPSLPSSGNSGAPGIIGADDAIRLDLLPPGDSARKGGEAIGRIVATVPNADTPAQCTAFLVAKDLVVTFGFYVAKATSGHFVLGNDGRPYTIWSSRLFMRAKILTAVSPC